jgi:acetate kinase
VDDYALVLNAGSSSLKFCVFQRPDKEKWRLAARGQIEGIGTSPRLSAKGPDGEKLVDEKLSDSISTPQDAIETLAVWLRSKYAGARVLGVGHRVVHGGPHFSGPTIVTDQVLAELHKLIPLAPLHQPYNLRRSKRLPNAFPCLRSPL